MRENHRKMMIKSGVFSVLAVLWTYMVQTVDVQPMGVNGTDIGFAVFNRLVAEITGVDMTLYHITDRLGIVPLAVCLMFGLAGLFQLIKRKSLKKVDRDIVYLGVYYVIVIVIYISFERFPVNYRPVLINGVMEASYPSSTTLLVLSVMPAAAFQADRRLKNTALKKTVKTVIFVFSAFMVAARLVSGVHWATDIIGALLISSGLIYGYKGFVMIYDKKAGRRYKWNSMKNCRS